MIKQYLIKWGIVVLCLLLFQACHKKDDPDPDKKPNRTILVYLGVDNNFDFEGKRNIEILAEHWNRNYDGHLLVYSDPGSQPLLVHIDKNRSGKPVIDTVEIYSPENSADPAVFRRVMERVRNDWPAESYGLVVLSHATGWLPEKSMNNPRSSRSIISDKTGGEMEIWDFAEAIPYKLDFILFDACLMGAVEVVYELKDKADYMLVSPAEVLQFAVEYDYMMDYLMKKEADLVGFARRFYEENDKKSGDSRSATVTVIKSDALEQLAAYSSGLLKGIDGEKLVNIAKIQNFGFGTNALYFDFGDYIHALYPERFDEFMGVLDQCILYKAHTPAYFSSGNGRLNEIKTYSGLSVYIPQESFPFLNQEYLKLKWTQRINK